MRGIWCIFSSLSIWLMHRASTIGFASWSPIWMIEVLSRDWGIKVDRGRRLRSSDLVPVVHLAAKWSHFPKRTRRPHIGQRRYLNWRWRNSRQEGLYSSPAATLGAWFLLIKEKSTYRHCHEISGIDLSISCNLPQETCDLHLGWVDGPRSRNPWLFGTRQQRKAENQKIQKCKEEM